jgi:hypothetical protein
MSGDPQAAPAVATVVPETETASSSQIPPPVKAVDVRPAVGDLQSRGNALWQIWYRFKNDDDPSIWKRGVARLVFRDEVPTMVRWCDPDEQYDRDLTMRKYLASQKGAYGIREEKPVIKPKASDTLPPTTEEDITSKAAATAEAQHAHVAPNASEPIDPSVACAVTLPPTCVKVSRTPTGYLYRPLSHT